MMCLGILRSGDDWLPVLIPLVLATPFLTQTRWSAFLLGLFVSLAAFGLTGLYDVRLEGTVASEDQIGTFLGAGVGAVIVAVLSLGMKWVHFILSRKWPALTIAHSQDNVRQFKEAGKILFLGMLRPASHLRFHESRPSGAIHFYRAFSLYCLLPVVLLNVVAIITECQSPDGWRFQDINPWTVVIAVPAQLIFGPLTLWVIAWCLYGGMSAAGLRPAEAKERLLMTGWYVGTALLCLGYWWLGFGVFFGSLRAFWRSIDPLLTIGIVIALAIWIRLALSAYYTNVPEPSGGKGARVFFGFIVGTVFFVIAMIPIGFVLQLILVAILRAT